MPAAPFNTTMGGRRAWMTLPRRALTGLVQGYRLLLSPWLGSACRFEPSCSRYALDALDRHGAAAGSYLTAGRLLRCHPWCEGGHDPVPAERPALFTHLFASATAPTVATASADLPHDRGDSASCAASATINPLTSSRP